uniref:Leucine-rich repeat-containing N-terminal plant-type domain-containing protein n=1 Tax=Zea mays TaxID=4577 RepID=A0A804PRY2_MAIZE
MPPRLSHRSTAAVPTLLLLLTLLMLSPPTTTAAAQHHCHRHHSTGDGVVISQADYQGLQAIKHDLSDPYIFLRSWNDSGVTACSGAWAGIKCVLCSVVAITLPWRGLGARSPRAGSASSSAFAGAIAGAVPSSLGFLTDPCGVYLFNNRFSAVANSTRLIQLNLSRNTLSDAVPVEVVASASLVFLDLSYNNLSGPIPDAFAGSDKSPSKLLNNNNNNKEAITGSYQLVFLSLAHNFLDGPIPASVTKLQQLDLYSNSLNGTIPTQLATLADLKVLDLSGNALSGDIPPGLDNLTATCWN